VYAEQRSKFFVYMSILLYAIRSRCTGSMLNLRKAKRVQSAIRACVN